MQEFKVGDWVRDTRQGMKNPIVQLKSNCIALTNPKEYATQYELWQPKEGEWCWFMNCYSPRLGKYKGTRTVLGNNTYVNEYGDEFVYIEPFIGTLPSFLKDN